MGYATGDVVVHPRHGVATVQGTTTRGEGDGATDYLELFFELKSLTIMLPVDSLDEVGIRPPATAEEAEVILNILGESADVPEAWAERNAKTLSRVQSTELVQSAMVIRDLTRHGERSGKPLSASENGTLQTCLEAVSLELAIALGQTQEETKRTILDKVGLEALDPT